MKVTQDSFRNALLDAKRPVPDGLHCAKGAPAGSRFSVYRNNVVVSLSEALATAFPLVKKLIGEESFSKLAGVFVRDHPPASPLMMFYGEAMPAFLESFKPLEHIGYLADCARLDLAIRQSYHAADAPKFDQSALIPDDNGEFSTIVRLAPSAKIIRSAWPLYDIWRFNNLPDAPKPQAGAQDILVSRPEFDPLPHLLLPGMADWLAALNSGIPFGQATEDAMSRSSSFDPTHALTLALSTQALTNTTTKDT